MILDRFKLTDKVAIVTGAGRGIGRAVAEAFAEVGADVVCAARTPEQIEETAAAVRRFGRRALAVPCDVNERAQLEHVVQTTLRELGRIDVVVNNAGGWPPKGWQRTNEKFLEGAFRFNVTHAFLLSRMAIPVMREHGGGAIVNISSAISRLIDPGSSPTGRRRLRSTT
jgi:7-alpha-hydroxysteroid dehydrogenase